MSEEEWAQDAQHEINEGGPVRVRAPQNNHKLLLVTPSKSSPGPDDHLMGSVLLKACAHKLEHAGHTNKLPAGEDAENHADATDAAGGLKPGHILMTGGIPCTLFFFVSGFIFAFVLFSV